MRVIDSEIEIVSRVHSVNEELKEVKSVHDQAVLILLEAERSAWSNGLESRLLLSRVRIRLSNRLFAEMDRVMKAVEQ